MADMASSMRRSPGSRSPSPELRPSDLEGGLAGNQRQLEFLGDLQLALRRLQRGLGLAREHMEVACPPPGERQAERMLETVGKPDRIVAAQPRPVGLAGEPGRQARKAAAADAGIVTGIFVGQIVVAVRFVEADRAFRMCVRRRRLAEEEIVGPEHVLGLDGETGIAVVPDHAGPSVGQLLRRRRPAAEHVVLGPAAQRREQARLVADPAAQFLGALEGGEHFGRAPAAGGHQGHPPRQLELDLAFVGVGDIVAPAAARCRDRAARARRHAPSA